MEQGNGKDGDATGRDRRRYERYDTSIEVDVGNGGTFLFAYIQNISAMGIFIGSTDPFEVGTQLHLRFAHAGLSLQLIGEVMWVNPVKSFSENLNPGMGVRFLDLSADQREKVVSMVRTIAYLKGDAVPQS